MSSQQDSRFCPYCNDFVLAQRPATNHALHAVVTLFMCGLWFPAWIAVAIFNSGNPYKCQRCGGATSSQPFIKRS